MENVYLQEAFKALDILNEEDFNVDTNKGREELSDFLNSDDTEDFMSVIDTEATDESELKDNYIGNLILDCNVCHSKLYKKPEDIHIDEETGFVGYGEECPYCYSIDGFTIIGKVAPYDEESDEVEVEEVEEESEEIEESSKSKKLKEGMEAINPNTIRKAEQCLIDNGIDPDEADIVLQAIGYILLDTELYPEDMEESLKKEESFDFNSDIYNALSDVMFKYRDKDVDEVDLDRALNFFADRFFEMDFDESLKEDTIKTSKGKWVNKGKEGTHGEFRTKKAADAQRKAMFAQGYKSESLKESKDVDLTEYQKWVDYDMEKLGRISKLTMSKIKDAGLSVVKDQYGEYEVIADRPIKEDFEKVSIETDSEKMEMSAEPNGKVTVTTEPKTTDNEVLAPLDAEDQTEINPSDEEVDVDVTEFSEDEFNELGESYLKNIYENVNSFKTSNVRIKDNKLVVEGIIGFNSGNNKKTSFVFESKDMTNKGLVRFIGENLEISKGKKSFTLTGSLNNGKFIAESFNYNYRAKDNTGKSTRVYGTVKVK